MKIKEKAIELQGGRPGVNSPGIRIYACLVERKYGVSVAPLYTKEVSL